MGEVLSSGPVAGDLGALGLSLSGSFSTPLSAQAQIWGRPVGYLVALHQSLRLFQSLVRC